MDDRIDPILDELAAGRIDQAEAARRIDTLRNAPGQPAPDDPAPDDPAPEEPAPDAQASTATTPTSWADIARGLAGAAGLLAESATEAVRAVMDEAQPTQHSDRPAPAAELATQSRGGAPARVVVRATARRVRIIADPLVADVKVVGEHQLRRAADRIEVSAAAGGSHLDAAKLLGPLMALRTARTVDEVRSGLGRTATGLGATRDLEVRVNPSMVVEADVTAGSLSVVGVENLGRVRLTGGHLDVRGANQLDEVLVQAATAELEGTLTGTGRLSVETGALTLRLAHGSDLTLVASTQLGRIAWPHGNDQASEYVVGRGSGRMQLGATMSTITVVTND